MVRREVGQLVEQTVDQSGKQKARTVVIAFDQVLSTLRREMKIPSREKTDFATFKSRDLRCGFGDEFLPSGTCGYSVKQPYKLVNFTQCPAWDHLSDGNDGKLLRDLGHSTRSER